MSVKNRQLGDSRLKGSLTVTQDVTAGDDLTVTGDAAVGGDLAVTGTINGSDRHTKTAVVTLAALDTGGGVAAWQNPEGAAIIITRVILDVTTKATGACTVDVGTTPTNATTSSDNLLDGVDVGTATTTADNITEKGTNGKSRQRLASGKWVTASMASGAAAGLAGKLYIQYILA
jgi:hypothetical protein